jgi:LacI family transcriptional regulator
MMKKSAGRPAATASARGARVTLGMVAAASGASPSTVSRILNGTAVVSQAKREAIDRAIAELGFVPNPIARGLAGGRTMSVGVISQAIDSPFYGVGLRGIEEELSLAGYSPLFVSGHWDADEEARCIDLLCSRRVDGMIVLTGRLRDEVLCNLAQEMPVVVTGRALRASNLYALDFDHFEGARLATSHLLALGHRRIAFVGGDPVHADAHERKRGYLAALAQAGLAADPALLLEGTYQEASGVAAARHLLDQAIPFSAIFAANDQMAFGAALELYRRGLRVPDDVSLMGVDDIPAAAHAIPPLSTIRQSVRELGQLAARSLLELLSGKTPTSVPSTPQLVVRDSTRPLDAK